MSYRRFSLAAALAGAVLALTPALARAHDDDHGPRRGYQQHHRHGDDGDRWRHDDRHRHGWHRHDHGWWRDRGAYRFAPPRHAWGPPPFGHYAVPPPPVVHAPPPWAFGPPRAHGYVPMRF